MAHSKDHCRIAGYLKNKWKEMLESRLHDKEPCKENLEEKMVGGAAGVPSASPSWDGLHPMVRDRFIP
jgi:hypothetical protein